MLPTTAVLLMSIHAHPVLTLWPSGPPEGWSRPDQEVTEHDPKGGFDIVKNVSRPTLEIFIAPKAKPHAPTVVVCPGGGYWIEAIQHEGREVAERLNAAGYHAAVLKYRLPNRDADKPLHKAPLQDAQRAIRLLRAHASEYGLDPGRIGILGFSAGGHLAAVASTTKDTTYARVDATDDASPRPAFTVLVYPAYLGTDGRPELPSEVKVAADTPPAFVVQTMDDRELVVSSFAYSLACQRAGVAAELHLFPQGGHGYGLRSKAPGLSTWPELLVAWLGRLR